MLSKLQEIKNNHEEGFTLIELLVVILIIGILAAVAVPMFLNNRKSGVDSTVTSDVKNASTQVEAWITKQGAKIVAIPATGTAIGDINVSEGTSLTVIGNSFNYCVSATNAGGADGVTGFKYTNASGKIEAKANCTGFVPTESATITGTFTK